MRYISLQYTLFLQLPEIKTTTTRTEETEVEEKPTVATTVAVEEAAPVETPNVIEKVDKEQTLVIEYSHRPIETTSIFFLFIIGRRNNHYHERKSTG